jgi:hypothetical protein
MRRTHRLFAALAALALIGAATSAQAAAWRSFGYPAQHTDMIGTKNDAGTAAFNLHCLPGNNLVELQVLNGPGGKSTTLSLLIDGRLVARHKALVTNVGTSDMIEFGGRGTTDAEVTRWLDGIASASSDIAISAGRSVAHFSLDGARSAATTALSYCKFG